MSEKYPIVFDVETQNSFDEVGGRDRFDMLKVSVLGVFHYADSSYQAFEEGEMGVFEKMYRNASLVIGFNIKAFDLPVIAPYFQGGIPKVPVLDLMDNVERVLGRRIGLDALGQATLGQGKTGHGLEALQWFRNGEVERVKQYCLDDVRITKDLYEYGKSHRQIFFKSRDTHALQSVPVDWGELPHESRVAKVKERLYSAWKRHQVVEIDYVSSNAVDGEKHRKVRKIEIQNIRNNEIEAFCHLRQDVRKFYVERVLEATGLDEFFGADLAKQQALL